ncbi:hypothetical protein VQ056_01535 [Paenibacillus sp. JTLBN-2024]
MKKIAAYVDERMNAISKNHARLDTMKLAVLTAVHMAEEALQVNELQNEVKMLTGERSELRSELAKLHTLRAEQQELYEKLREEHHASVKEKEELRKQWETEQAELKKQLEDTKTSLGAELQKTRLRSAKSWRKRALCSRRKRK